MAIGPATARSLTARDALEAREAGWLAPTATPSRGAARAEAEAESGVRTAFQRDRDRVLHTKSFRRLMHKTQVFIAPVGDHYRTRLTHTLEVGQVARTIGRALRLNEDLIEAIALGHDLGHTPFGHAGERALAEAFPGFRHNEQSLRVVDRLERDGRGLNLTDPVRDGILNHSKFRSGIAGDGGTRPATLEGEVVRMSDAIAYVNHDLDDALRGGLIADEDVPRPVLERLGETHAARIDAIVCDVIDQSETDALPGAIRISPDVRAAADNLRDVLFARVYTPLNAESNTHRAQHIVRALFAHFAADPARLPAEDRLPAFADPPERQAADYVASMTDRFAIELYERLFVPRHWSV
ncbi:MAG: dNTP triphosphohydrolase, broad substrate specificity [uncultured Thermomicrobiales bacterium]|uniref:Deoxyguanosinetriphosphate triphosphohydrolase-like protein n=1 Tax=uncultured Thermomicrobiales bacterium TaxID=1645740 RepID=A0A6J4VNC0_9BACT|nr:MAG: dNTP triphosphohydrolase, broad substrate specificity [uncultured Thermomicrobiales bacterium]